GIAGERERRGGSLDAPGKTGVSVIPVVRGCPRRRCLPPSGPARTRAVAQRGSPPGTYSDPDVRTGRRCQDGVRRGGTPHDGTPLPPPARAQSVSVHSQTPRRSADALDLAAQLVAVSVARHQPRGVCRVALDLASDAGDVRVDRAAVAEVGAL